MKKILFILLACVMLFSACQDTFLDLDPQDSITEAAYYKTPDHFKAGTNDLYYGLAGWRTTYDNEFRDFGTDLCGYAQEEGRGDDVVPDSDGYWTNTYKYLRKINTILEKAAEYDGDQADIAEYVAVAKFFRAYQHFFLLQRFGGVPIATEVPDISSDVVSAPRNSRYEVFAQVLTDIDEAIADLPTEQQIAEVDKGKISKWAAEAFKAKALLFEATWEKNVGTTTDGDGSTNGAGSVKPASYPSFSEMIQMANTLAKDVMDNGGYSLWNHNAELDNLSTLYLYNLEDAGSNPAGLEKASNHEYILYSKYDYDLYRGNQNISHTARGRLAPSRKLMDMFLCLDGKTAQTSEQFLGYATCDQEFENRDYRMKAYFADVDTWELFTPGTLVLPGASGGAGVAWECRKFYSWNYGSYRNVKEESFDYPIIRLPEVYFIYAETLYEMNGSLTDAQMAESINKVKERAGLPGITNASLAANGMNIYDEIMRERAIELYSENNRYLDLKRLGIAEQELNEAICGPIVEGNAFENNLALYDPATYNYGTKKIQTKFGLLDAVVIDPAEVRNFERKHYLFPLPIDQMDLNSNLLQNPGY
ncbi:RagB/SusD family nutrient uptake outer membrane protein [Marinifilum sp. RC60d5]|uniref:RagB/SusD family nutrient uptake outer membrane protein n=1 Tax=Marinifilum sp. RC60d5 TaxID=3458414 RepID=UPI004035C1EC